MASNLSNKMKKVGEKIKSFFIQSIRVWHLTRKPDKQEIKTVSKVSALGILAVGVIGFILSAVIEFILKLKA